MTEKSRSWEEILAAAAAASPADDPLADPAEVELKARLAAARALLYRLRPVKNPGRFLEPDAVEAAALLSVHDPLYHWQLQEELRPHHILQNWKKAISTAGKEMAEAEVKVAEKTRLIALATELLELWHDGGEAWCWPKEHGPGCCWRLPSAEVKRHLSRPTASATRRRSRAARKCRCRPGAKRLPRRSTRSRPWRTAARVGPSPRSGSPATVPGSCSTSAARTTRSPWSRPAGGRW